MFKNVRYPKGRRVSLKIFDSHFHIIDFDFPIIENNGYNPPAYTVDDYNVTKEELNIVGGAVVSGSYHGYDQSYLISALEKLGPNFVGVSHLPAAISDSRILQLNDSGIQAVRFNIEQGGSAKLDQLQYFSDRIYDLVGWHTELYIDSKEIKDILPILKRIKKVSIDHLGISKEGLPNLYKFVENGGYVKASGFGRVDFDVEKVMKEIYDIRPDALMFGTDLPSTRAKTVFDKKDINHIKNVFDKDQLNKIMYENAYNFYFEGK